MIHYEEKFSVKVDVQIPDEDKRYLYTQWEQWREGIKNYMEIEEPSLMTRYEHYALGSGVGLPPDPFKPLCLQHDGADLEKVIHARREYYPPGEEKEGSAYPYLVANLQLLLKVEPENCSLVAEIPEINLEGRVPIAKIVKAYVNTYTKKKGIQKRQLDISLEVLAQLQLPTSRDDLKMKSGTILREVFDFENGYRIELVDFPK